MKVIGLDPGLTATGWAVLEGPRGHLVAHGLIKFSSLKKIEARLAFLYQELSKIIALNRPAVMSIEKIFVHKNPSSALVLGYARGVAMMTAALQGMEVVEYAPTKVKQSLTGYGHASKAQMIEMIHRLFHVKVPSDTADAVALAFCHTPFLKG